jgi:hypothetical protein
MKKRWKEFVVRTLLLIDFLGAVPVFGLMILVDPDRYIETLVQSGETIRRRVEKYRGDE